jgi:hypothetical protein
MAIGAMILLVADVSPDEDLEMTWKLEKVRQL